MRSPLRPALVALLAVTAVAACSDDSEPLGSIQPAANVRIVHASPDAPNVDVLVDDAVALTNVGYRAASAYLTVAPGSRRLRVRAAGLPDVVPIDATVPLVNRGNYTVLATGLLAGIQPLVTTDTLTAPAAGNVKIRVIHAAPAAGNVDVYATAPNADINTATPVLTNVPFRGVSGYLEVPAGGYQLRVTPAGTKTVAISAIVVLNAGAVRTVVATDAPGGGAPLGAIILNDLN
jgi:hypothetical protein